MENLLETMGIAFILILIAIALLTLSLLLTGKLTIKKGSCGRDPTKKQDDLCGTKSHCALCDHNEENKKKPADDEEEDELQ